MTEEQLESRRAQWRRYYERSKAQINSRKNAKRNAAYVHHPRVLMTEEERKASHNAAVRRYYQRTRERWVKYHRKWKKENRDKVCASASNYRKKYPEKGIAHRIFNYAIKTGFVIRSTVCSNCGIQSKRIEAHHPDYSKPLEVIWLCKKCHAAIHV